MHSALGVEQTQIRDQTQEVATSGPSTSSRSRGRTSSEQPATKVPRRSNRDQNVWASAEINPSAESHGTQFHGPTSAMFDGEHPLERKKVDSLAVTNTSQKTQLLAESARQRMPQLPFPQMQFSIFWGCRLTCHG